MGDLVKMVAEHKRRRTQIKKLKRQSSQAEKQAEKYTYWIAARRDKRRLKNGFTPALYALALERQEGRCAICAEDLVPMPAKKVHADHDHLTGLPRGVLCDQCNLGLGRFKDDPETLEAAVRYLASPPLGLV
ncbi:MAG: endonuclease VII domain-containing protein [Deltaproteobacteria bacterium]|nr:endonuclease VII domain-containing protein [Deltaproteobacteria bacterium]